MDYQNQNKVIQIFKELQKDKKMIASQRVLELSSNISSFKSSFFKLKNIIYYNPSVLGLDDDSIRFCLLHEEGHFVNKQFGFYCFPLFSLLGAVPFLITTFLLHSNSVYQIISILIVPFAFFLSWKFFPQFDEYKSDEFAAILVKEHYLRKKPSEILKQALDFIYAKGSFPLDPHPSPENRVKSIKDKIDDK